MRQGFTLLELLISMAILTVFMLLGGLAVQMSITSVDTAEAAGMVQAEVRNVLQAVSAELALSAKRGNDALTPPLQDVTITENPAPNAPIELVFQVPLDDVGRTWSNPIRYRFVTEDANGNARLDPGEDSNGNGRLDRCIERIQDRNGDGDADDPGERTVLAGANNLNDVRFARVGNEIVVTVEATRLPGRQRIRPVTARVTGRVYLLN